MISHTSICHTGAPAEATRLNAQELTCFAVAWLDSGKFNGFLLSEREVSQPINSIYADADQGVLWLIAGESLNAQAFFIRSSEVEPAVMELVKAAAESGASIATHQLVFDEASEDTNGFIP